jgi:2-C-methyl-D-erythritol 2,4-cyclodiphosphate synthase
VNGGQPILHVGHGFDVHPFSQDLDRPLVLGGVTVPGAPGLAGHSDGDVITHAIIDALLGAAGLDDIGQQFPDTDPSLEGIDSVRLLERVMGTIGAAQWTPQNVDCTAVLEAPKLAPLRPAIQSRLSDVVGAPVSIKAKRAEGLGSLGRSEGVACFAVALLTRPGAAG